VRMGPPPGALPPMRMTASWSGSKRTDRIQVCGAKMRPMASSPRIVTQTCAVRRRTSKREAHLAVHRPSACSGVKALRNTSDAKAASRQAPLAFRSLDPFRALREPDRRRRDEERPSRSEQRTGNKTKNNHLTGKAPYKFESPLLQRRVECEPDSFARVRRRGEVSSETLRANDRTAKIGRESSSHRTPHWRKPDSTSAFASLRSGWRQRVESAPSSGESDGG